MAYVSEENGSGTREVALGTFLKYLYSAILCTGPTLCEYMYTDHMVVIIFTENELCEWRLIQFAKSTKYTFHEIWALYGIQLCNERNLYYKFSHCKGVFRRTSAKVRAIAPTPAMAGLYCWTDDLLNLCNRSFWLDYSPHNKCSVLKVLSPYYIQ